MKKENQEEHPHLPSGYWKGFYVYKNDPEKHEMRIELDFKNNKISGTGGDDVGGFVFTGTYNLEIMRCKMTKQYSTHRIDYQGSIDENGIWGIWKSVNERSDQASQAAFNFLMEAFPSALSGGFHIWPSSRDLSEEKQEEKEIAVKKVLETTMEFS